MKDKRYSIQKEFCGEWVGQSRFHASALMLALGHDQRRKGALVVTEQKPESSQ